MAYANAEALEIALGALDGLTAEHAAIVEHARTLAQEIDAAEHRESETSKLHGEYRQVLKVLLEVGRRRELDAFEKLLNKLTGDD